MLVYHPFWSPRLAWESLLSTIDSVCLSGCLSVCHAPSNYSFLFIDGIKPFFWPSFLHVALYKTLFLDFWWFRPPNAQNLLPRICTKLRISQLVCQIDRRCLGLPGGLRGWPIQWNHAKCCGADPCCHDNKIWTRRGDPVAYRLVSVLFVVWINECVLFITHHGRPRGKPGKVGEFDIGLGKIAKLGKVTEVVACLLCATTIAIVTK